MYWRHERGHNPGLLGPIGAVPQTPSIYVKGGRYGPFLGYPEGTDPATLTQTVALGVGGFNWTFDYRRHETYGEPLDNLFQAVYGRSLDNLTVLWSASNLGDTGVWLSMALQIDITQAGNHIVGYRFYDVWGEWALDNNNLRSNPEPSTLFLVSAPVAWMLWRSGRGGKTGPCAS